MSRAKSEPASAKARRKGCAVLEVLAGLRTPKEASEALGLSLQRYYTLEARAIGRLVAALEPRPRGRQVSGAAELTQLREERDRLQRELQRANSLVRVAQRSVGLGAAQTPAQRQKAKTKAKKAGKRGPRRPVVRARRAIRRLRPDGEDGEGGAGDDVPKGRVVSDAQLAREAREAVGLSQRAFAQLIGANKGTVAEWESGRGRLSLLTRSLLCLVVTDPGLAWRGARTPTDLQRRSGIRREWGLLLQPDTDRTAPPALRRRVDGASRDCSNSGSSPTIRGAPGSVTACGNSCLYPAPRLAIKVRSP